MTEGLKVVVNGEEVVDEATMDAVILTITNENQRLHAELDAATAENQRLIKERADNERANIASRRSICEQSDRYKAERDALQLTLGEAAGRLLAEGTGPPFT